MPRAIVLAGGRSSRFGTDKALAEVDGKPLVELVISGLLSVFARIFVVTKDPQLLRSISSDRVRLVRDRRSTQATLVGIMEGLRHSDRTLNFITGCDMPGVVRDLIEELYHLCKGADCALRLDQAGVIQPLGGFYSKKALPKIEKLVAEERYTLKDALCKMKVRALPFEAVVRLDPQLKSFWNVNTRDDLAGLAAVLE